MSQSFKILLNHETDNRHIALIITDEKTNNFFTLYKLLLIILNTTLLIIHQKLAYNNGFMKKRKTIRNEVLGDSKK